MKKHLFISLCLLHAVCQLMAASPTGIYTSTINSDILGEERTLFISVPAKYEENTHHYPVVYVLDADFLFDITRSITQLRAARNYMPESIIVGLPNTWRQRFQGAANWKLPNGQKFFNPPGNPKTFLKFIKQELIPHIEQNYRTNTHRSVIGLSPTTGPVFEALWSEQGLFKAHVALAIAVDMVDESDLSIADKLLTSILDETQPPGTSVYVGIAGNDVTKRPERGQGFADINKQLKAHPNPHVNYRIEIIPDEEHYGMAVPGLQHAFELIYPRHLWNVNYATFWDSPSPAQAIQAHYETLSKHHGFKIIPLQDGYFASHNLLGVGRRLSNQKRFQERLDMFRLGLQYYPNSAPLYEGLAESYLALNQPEKALEAGQKAVQLGIRFQHADLNYYRETLQTIENHNSKEKKP
ncbi:alpha/beta hydrolase-fold protein [Marinicella sp. W31]|uniref:alpha/beta hydrolase-fold protein n=1 Tax=Marinicella sp. W31 TaxID=3023713 RepID=UPI0037570B7C